jgi:calcium-dependent protein kinase
MLSEIDILRMMEHDHVMKLFEVYESDRYIHMVMEYLPGGELFDKIRSKVKYSESDAKEVMKRLLSALAYMNDNNIVHRDLKPANLILKYKETDNDLIIADFGLAVQLQPGEKLNLCCGSPGFIGPEVLHEGEGYNCKADVFSAGAIMFFLLHGKPLFFAFDGDK